MADGFGSRAPLWPLVLLGLAQAAVISWLVGTALIDHWPVIRPGGIGGGHGGHGGTSAGPAPIADEQTLHYLGLVAFAAHALLPAVAVALAVARRVTARWRQGLVGQVAFAAAVGGAGAVAAVCTSWIAVRSSTGALDGLSEVALVSATGAFRYSFLMALVVALLGGAWCTRVITMPGQRNPAVRPVELAQ
nr:hypothetical protein [Kibdelosporangium sp. MJ126-NF4]CEL20596.1 hypothetical protein [Kibdelosporangium sp. MJ126-NF4]CTQ89507.1 hypothetical protein [Kibdelosporangium sp. MJ126-NF4]